MPAASDELRALWGFDKAISFLSEVGYQITKRWSWACPFGHTPTDRERSAAQYLIDEWDFDGIEEDHGHRFMIPAHEVDAIRWTGDFDKVKAWWARFVKTQDDPDALKFHAPKYDQELDGKPLFLPRTMNIPDLGDWIIADSTTGEITSCSEAEFRRVYHAVSVLRSVP